MINKRKRLDHQLIFELIEPGSRVLDLGCGNGELLARLVAEKKITGQAVERNPVRVAAAIRGGVAVYQKDLDSGLPEFKNNSFDYAILEMTLQQLERPLTALEETLRVSKYTVVSFPNFNYKEVVGRLIETGRMPVTPALPHRWHNTPNIHLFTLYDFLDWAEQRGVKVVAGYASAAGSDFRPLDLPDDSSGAEELLFVITLSGSVRPEQKRLSTDSGI
jgi:methionine biosynthesis protein MetW